MRVNITEQANKKLYQGSRLKLEPFWYGTYEKAIYRTHIRATALQPGSDAENAKLYGGMLRVNVKHGISYNKGAGSREPLFLQRN